MSEAEAPIEHPGQRLVEDFLEPMRLSPTRLARAIGVPTRLLLDLVEHHACIDAELALRLACFFGTKAEFWLELQSRYDLDHASRRDGARIRREIQPGKGKISAQRTKTGRVEST